MTGGRGDGPMARLRERAAGLGRRDRRALAVLAGVALLAGGWKLVAAPYVAALRESRRELASARRLLAAERALLAHRDAYPPIVKRNARSLRASGERLLDGRSEGVAVAELTQLLEDQAQAARVLISRADPMASSDSIGPLAPISLGVQGESDLRGILTLVDFLEDGPKLLRIEGLRIEGRAGLPGAGRGTAPASETLAFQLQVTGYRLVLGPPEAGPAARTAARARGGRRTASAAEPAAVVASGPGDGPGGRP